MAKIEFTNAGSVIGTNRSFTAQGALDKLSGEFWQIGTPDNRIEATYITEGDNADSFKLTPAKVTNDDQGAEAARARSNGDSVYIRFSDIETGGLSKPVSFFDRFRTTLAAGFQRLNQPRV